MFRKTPKHPQTNDAPALEGIQPVASLQKGPNVRHDIDPVLVKAQIEHKIAEQMNWRSRRIAEATVQFNEYHRALAAGENVLGRWTRPPQEPSLTGQLHDRISEQERNHYSLVRVIELPKTGKRFVLVYGDVDDATVAAGTGPFASFEAAAGWFLRSGR